MKKLIFATILSISKAEFTFETCFACADKTDFTLCSVGGRTQNAWTGACCSAGDSSPECVASDTNVCSETYSSSQHMFYSHCPLNNHTMCTKGTTTIFEAEATPRNFQFSNLRRTVDDEGNPIQMDACTYEIKASKHGYKSGNLIIRFNQITETDVYINAGTEVSTAKEVISDSVEQYKEYSVDISKGSVFAIVIPKEGKETSFQMQYWVDGVENSGFKEWWHDNFSTK